ncbi:hypothetical protein GCM10010495_13670 [Kitasatospora herbaricolor]|uniref:hypothetical protein n=1 Tax=Kitasatospora herbaricolor TaxID=68217 RepID=UPI00174A02CD|nr:hypothetical protein [Kitasatospora herbaricolor]MDQ0309176.1 hypothetical protein [Kitasatospora herbaricolor]GGV03506.1 hypothetical protein GCM10010495_13670 [Kitasatospora herbaricolor]
MNLSDTAAARPAAWTAPANEFRTRLGQWMQQIPTGGAWKSFGSAFALFLMHAAQKADADGTNLHRAPSNEWFAKSCRTSKDSIPRFYRAAAEAGLMTLAFGPSGARVRGYACVLPIGGVPRWEAALAVLRQDRRRVRQAARRTADRPAVAAGGPAGTSEAVPAVPAAGAVPAPAAVPAAGAVPASRAATVDNSAHDARPGPVPGCPPRKSARAGLPGEGAGRNSSARAGSGRSARTGSQVRTCGPDQEADYQDRTTAGLSRPVTTPRVRALLSVGGAAAAAGPAPAEPLPAGPRTAGPAGPDDLEHTGGPQHRDRPPAGVPAAPACAAPPPEPAGPAAPGAGWPAGEVVRPGTPGWDELRATMRAIRERLGGGRRR